MNSLILAAKKGQALVDEINSTYGASKGLRIWWLGQSGYLLQWKGKRVLIDPYLSDSLTKKYANTEKPHIRMSELTVRPELLKNISIVTSSHNHTDHLDADTLIPILKNNPKIKFIIPEANREFVCKRVQCAIDFPIGMNDGTSKTIDDFTFIGVPAKHNEIERDGNGNCKFMGYIIQFGPYTVYHSGDTLWFDNMAELLGQYPIDVAILPINGNDPSRKVAGNLNIEEAVRLGKAINASYVIPCHYDMFTFNTANVNEFEVQAQESQQGFKVLLGGECFSLNKV